ncbi:hypothetical protein FF38_08551 [Lucilia cuprina]|uniref:Uncharacterized protein n=1 Tax=Lucilia cuprina TaxID=7375 RepID=A0A0L0CBZ5_LUCCU|nr:hypothetical protein FF38_08551 [Lucilia cuprina]
MAEVVVVAAAVVLVLLLPYRLLESIVYRHYLVLWQLLTYVGLSALADVLLSLLVCCPCWHLLTVLSHYHLEKFASSHHLRHTVETLSFAFETFPLPAPLLATEIVLSKEGKRWLLTSPEPLPPPPAVLLLFITFVASLFTSLQPSVLKPLSS